MRQDKLRAFLDRQRVGAHMIVLQHEQYGEASTFATFPIDPMPDVETIFDACGDLADELEQAVRVAIVVVNENNEQLAKCFHKQMPAQASSEHALNAADVSSNTIIAQLLHHIEVQQKCVTASHGTIYSAFERTLAQMQKLNERQAAQIQSLTDAIRNLEAAQGTEQSEEARNEALARTQAWEKFSELGPQVVEFMLKAVNTRMSGAANSNGHVNGSARVVD